MSSSYGGSCNLSAAFEAAACEYAMAKPIREILMAEQEHQIDLATALGEAPPDMTA